MNFNGANQVYPTGGNCQQFTLEVDASAMKRLASEICNPQLGPRPLDCAVQEYLLDPLATKLLTG